jgi:UDP-perosamine 4-acetyltransferase
MKMVILGAGGHATVLVDLFRAQGLHEIIGCVGSSKNQLILGVPVIGELPRWDELRRAGVQGVALGIGDNSRRLVAAREAEERGFELVRAIHPHCWVSPGASIGPGTVVMAGAVVQAGTTIGIASIVNTLSGVDHDCQIGDGVHIAPRGCLCGRVTIGEGTFLGAGTTVLPETLIGSWVTR